MRALLTDGVQVCQVKTYHTEWLLLVLAWFLQTSTTQKFKGHQPGILLMRFMTYNDIHDLADKG